MTALQAIVAYAIAAGLFVLPAVVAITMLRYGPVVGFVSLGALATLFVFALGPLTGLSLLLGFGGMGLALWHYGRRPIRLEYYFSGLVATFLTGTIGVTAVGFALARIDPIDAGGEVFAQVGLAFDAYLKLLRDNAGLENQAYITQLAAARQTWVWAFFKLTPSMLTAGATAIALINFLLVRRVTPALWGLSLNRWRTPDHAIWAVLAAGLGVLPQLLGPMVGRVWGPAESLFFVAMNVLLIALLPYVIQGLAVISFFLERWRLPRFLRGLTYFLVLTQGLLAAVAALGLMEFWVDLRGRALRPKNQGSTEHE